MSAGAAEAGPSREAVDGEVDGSRRAPCRGTRCPSGGDEDPGRSFPGRTGLADEAGPEARRGSSRSSVEVDVADVIGQLGTSTITVAVKPGRDPGTLAACAFTAEVTDGGRRRPGNAENRASADDSRSSGRRLGRRGHVGARAPAPSYVRGAPLPHPSRARRSAARPASGRRRI